MTDGPFGSKLKSAHYVEDGPIRVIRLGNVGIGHFDDRDKAFLPAERLDDLRKHQAFAGDLIIAALADPVGRACQVPENFGLAVVKADCVRFKPAPEVSPRFIMHWLNSPQGLSQAAETAHGVGRIRINLGEMRRLGVPVPPAGEQRRIVARLDDLLARARRARKILADVPALLDQIRQSMLAAAFRGDLTADWRHAQSEIEPAAVLLERIRAERRRRFEEANPKKKYVPPARLDAEGEGLPDLPAGWEWVHLNELIEGFVAGRSPRAEPRPADPDEYGVLKVSAVSWGEFRPHENKAMVPGDIPSPDAIIKRGDLLISRANTVELVGAVVLVPQAHDRLMLSDKTLRIQYLPGIDPQYLLFALRTQAVRSFFEVRATGTSASMRNLSQAKIRKAPIAVAPLAEQREIAIRLARKSTSLTALRDELGQLQHDVDQFGRSVLERAFRGELAPRDDSDEPVASLLARIRAAGASTTTTRKTGRATSMGKKVQLNRERLVEALAQMPSDSFAFEDLRRQVGGDYETLKSLVFSLLDEDAPVIEQRFDTGVDQMRLRRTSS